MRATAKRPNPTKGTIGYTYVTHGPEFSLEDMVAFAEHARMDPEQARQMLRDLVESIPAADLERFVGAQITVVT